MKNFKKFFKNTSENGGINLLKVKIVIFNEDDDEDDDFDYDFGSLLC